jgi:hypothetical protein
MVHAGLSCGTPLSLCLGLLPRSRLGCLAGRQESSRGRRAALVATRRSDSGTPSGGGGSMKAVALQLVRHASKLRVQPSMHITGSAQRLMLPNCACSLVCMLLALHKGLCFPIAHAASYAYYWLCTKASSNLGISICFCMGAAVTSMRWGFTLGWSTCKEQPT